MILIDKIPEYKEMRRGLMALRLEVPPEVADDILALCERAVLVIEKKPIASGDAEIIRLREVLQTALDDYEMHFGRRLDRHDEHWTIEAEKALEE